MPTILTPAATLHNEIHVPSNNVDAADAAWMALYTWKELGDNAKYALDQIDVKIATMLSGNVVIGGNLSVGVSKYLTAYSVALDTLESVAGLGNPITVKGPLVMGLGGSVPTWSGGRRVEVPRTISTWPGDPPSVDHQIVQGNVVRAVVGAATVNLNLLSTGAVEGDWVRVTLGSIGTLNVNDGASESLVLAMDTIGQQVTFTYFTATGWAQA